MNYYFSKVVSLGPKEAEDRLTDLFLKEGFGLISEITTSDKIKEKLNEDFPYYRILGYCNVGYAKKVIEAEPNIGLFLPCNAVIRETASGTEVSVTNTEALMGNLGNPGLTAPAAAVNEVMQKVLDQL